MRVTYVAISSENIEAAKKLHRIVFPIPYAGSFYRKLLDKKAQGILACAETPVGFCTYTAEADTLHLLTIGVAAAYTDCGIGSAMLARAEQYGRLQNARTVRLCVLCTNTRAIRFYSERGYAVSRRVERYCGSEDALEMHKTLSDSASRDSVL